MGVVSLGRNGISVLQIGEEGENDFVITQFRPSHTGSNKEGRPCAKTGTR